MKRRTRLYNSTAIVAALAISYLAAFVGASSSEKSLWDSSWSKGLLDDAPPEEKTQNVSRKTTPKKNTDIDEDEPWRQQEGWWKDPLSMFDDDDEYVGDSKPSSGKTEATDDALKEMEAKADREKREADKKAAREKEQAEQKAETEKIALLEAAEKGAQSKKAAEGKAAQEKEVAKKASLEKAAMEKAALERAAERAAEKEKAAKIKAAEKLAAKQKREEEKAARERERQERKAQREHDKEFQKAMKSASGPSERKGLNLNASQLAVSLPALKAGLARVPFLTSPGPAIGLFASAVMGKVILDKIRRKSSQDEPTSEPFLEDLSDYPAALARQQDTMQFQLDEMRYSDAYSDETTETDASDAIDVDSDVDSSPPDSFERDQIAKIGTSNPSSSPAFLGGLRTKLVGGHSRSVASSEKIAVSGGRRVKVTSNELEYLKTVADQAVLQRQAMEQEYEKTSFHLQQAQSEVSQLASTTKYLKSQLKDYEEMMDRTIRNERKRAKVEIQKMKEIMEVSIEQDRESLRKQFTSELERLQAQYENERAKREDEAAQGLSEHEYDDEEEEQMDDLHETGSGNYSPNQDNSTITDAEYPQEYARKGSTKPRRRSRRNNK